MRDETQVFGVVGGEAPQTEQTKTIGRSEQSSRAAVRQPFVRETERISERIVPAARVFQPLLDDIYDLSAAVPTPLDTGRRRRLAPEAVVALDWHNDMSKLILDINDRIEAAADDRARGVIIRRLRRALEP